MAHSNQTGYYNLGFDREMFHFADSIIYGKAPEPNMEDIKHTMELLERLNRSVQKNCLKINLQS